MYSPNGCAEAHGIWRRGTDFLVYYDPDNDGLIAGYLCEVFLDAYDKKHIHCINTNRAHGFYIPREQWKALEGKTVFAVDFAMSTSELRELTDCGVNIINIDHHNIDENELFYYKSDISGAESVIINNQYSFEPQEYRFLSGAGMVYYVLGYFNKAFMNEDTKALVGISLLTDIREIENDIAKDFLTSTYCNQSDKFQYLVNLTKGDFDGGFGMQNMDRNFIDYSFSPKLNALFRLNMGEDAIRIIKGKFPLERRNDLNVFKAVQNGVIDIILENLQGYEGNNTIIKYVYSDLETPQKVNISNFIGVACSRIKNFGKTSFLYVADKEGKILRGSVRGKFDNVNYLQVFRKHGFHCEGHKVAFGVISGDLKSIDLDALDAEIHELEIEGEKIQYRDRLVDVSNLSIFLSGKNREIAKYNNFVRDSKRILLHYTGCQYEVEQKGKMWLYKIDGIPVKCFDESLNLDNGYILPLAERAGYIQCYLRRPN